MDDWTGSSRLRRKPKNAGLFHVTRPLPAKLEYHIPAKTSCLFKRAGDGNWKQFHTTKPNTFDSIYRETAQSLIFFCDGWLLSVKREYIKQQNQSLSAPGLPEGFRMQEAGIPA